MSWREGEGIISLLSTASDTGFGFGDDACVAQTRME